MKTLHLKILVLALAAGLVSAGCGDKGGPDPKAAAAQLDSAMKIRKIFDESGHVAFEALDADSKATVVKLCDNDAAKAKTTWDYMKNGANGGGGGAPPVHPPDPNKPGG